MDDWVKLKANIDRCILLCDMAQLNLLDRLNYTICGQAYEAQFSYTLHNANIHFVEKGKILQYSTNITHELINCSLFYPLLKIESTHLHRLTDDVKSKHNAKLIMKITYRSHHTDDALFQQSWVNIISSFTSASLFNNYRHKWHQQCRSTATAVERATRSSNDMMMWKCQQLWPTSLKQ